MTPSPQPITVLLIEDTADDVRLLRTALAEHGAAFDITPVDRLAAGLAHLARTAVDIVLLDLQLPDSQGLETLIRLRREAPSLPIVVLTASDDDELALQALQQGAQDYVVKGYAHVYRNLLVRAMRYAIERKRAEDAVRAAHAETEELLRSIPAVLIGLDARGLVTHWNAVAEATFGVRGADALHRNVFECGIHWGEPDQLLQRLVDCQAHRAPASFDELQFTRPDGRTGFLGITCISIRGAEGLETLVFALDVTERRQAEAERLRLQGELLHAQRMETVGRFAGGIAHDFNSFLQVILGFAWMLRSRHREDAALRADIEEIVHAAESASAMVRQLLTFSRRQPIEPRHVELNRTVRQAARLLQQFVGERARVELRLDADPLWVRVDPTALEQILMNLCANARDSMAEGGTLTIATSRQAFDAAFVASHPWAKVGRYVRLSIRDTGSGMPPEVAAHAFEPFFTTKSHTRGFGLGLSVVYGLVQQHGGLVQLETAPGQGTTFSLHFLQQGPPPEEEDDIREREANGRAPGESSRGTSGQIPGGGFRGPAP